VTAPTAVLPAGARLESVASDVFVDLTEAGFDRTAVLEYLEHLTREACLDGCVSLALPGDTQLDTAPPGVQVDAATGQPATVLLSRAIDRAVALRRHLVVLLGPVIPEQRVLSLLVETFDRDPQFGTAQPRFAQDQTERVWPLPGAPDRDWTGAWSSTTVLPLLPQYTITPELLASCMVLRWGVLVGADEVAPDYTQLNGALLRLLIQTRRRGFRNVVVNQAVVRSRLAYRRLYPALAEADLDQLRAKHPDHDLASAEIKGLSQRRMEPLLSVAHGETGDRRIVVDARDIPAGHNGSSQCVLGFLDGLAALDCAGQIEALVSPAAARFHRMRERYPNLRALREHPSGEYLGAVTLTQPWSMDRVAELHRHALLVAFTMLDTIGWDVLYPSGADGLGRVWRFVARHADAMLYISHFTRERFNTRFPVHPGVAEKVTHLSFRQDEHVRPAARAEPVSDHILVFGNHFDHKDLRPTVRLLADAFPFNRIVAFGLRQPLGPNVTAMSSGGIQDSELHRLIASARVIVYPSLYEGFGLPVVEGLAYGRPVVVRRSPLWAEIAGWSRLPGPLIEFDDPPSLVECVGRALAGLPGSALPSGVRLANDASPAGWRDCAERIIATLNVATARADGSRWRERDDALSLADA